MRVGDPVPENAGPRGGQGPGRRSMSTAQMLERAEQQLVLRQYSPKTRRAYMRVLRRFAAEVDGTEITGACVRAYLLKRIESDVSVGYHGQLVAALRFFCQHVLGRRDMAGEIPVPRRAKQLPAVLSVGEVKRLIAAFVNPKHRMMALLLYSAGLRVGELVKLRVNDLDLERGMIRVRGGKGRKDRYTLYSAQVADAIVAWRKLVPVLDPDGYVFVGFRPGRPITARTVQRVITLAAQDAGIRKRITPHTLRHSFATHLLEQGVDLRYIQELLGHASSRTTDIYTHVTNRNLIRIRSPLDTLLSDDG